MQDYAWVFNGRREICGTGHYLWTRHIFGKRGNAIDAVLKCYHSRCRADEGNDCGSCGFAIIKLHCKNDDIHKPDLGGCVGGADMGEFNFSEWALHAQALRLHCSQMTAPSDECNILASLSQLCANIAADTA